MIVVLFNYLDEVIMKWRFKEFLQYQQNELKHVSVSGIIRTGNTQSQTIVNKKNWNIWDQENQCLVSVVNLG